VLGAGGTKGFAHVGALKVLHQRGIPIHLIVGASAGALFGSLYAALGELTRLEAVVRRLAPSHLLRWFLRGLNLGPPSYLGRRLGEVLHGLDFADLKVPFAAVALDLATGRRVVLRRGSVAEAVQASISPPVIVGPVWLEERFLLDGGVHNTLPVDVAYELGADLVIAIHLGDAFVLPPPLRPAAAAVALHSYWNSARPPSISSQVAFMARLLAQGRPWRRQPDVLIRPNMAGISAISPFHIRTCLERGERAARAALPLINAALARPA
ncbi:MAG: patatin-like phospholipase family protein, partial [Dehalococcoidia bacterium]